MKSQDHNPLQVILLLGQYPILAPEIRRRMRVELFKRGIISINDFEHEVKQKARESQNREGMVGPLSEEDYSVWEARLAETRDSLGDFYFSYNLPFEVLEQIIEEIVGTSDEQIRKRGDLSANELEASWNEYSPIDVLFASAETLEKKLDSGDKEVNHKLEEIKLFLIRSLISDQLGYLRIAKKWISLSTLKQVYSNRIGNGPVGGKAAGIILSTSVLQEKLSPQQLALTYSPPSYFIGTDVFFEFMSLNHLNHWTGHKYKSYEEMHSEYPRLRQEFLKGKLPGFVREKIKTIIEATKSSPLVVRSSSLLEDNFGTSFAGIYKTVFCANQGTHEESLIELEKAICEVYASTFRQEALVYRQLRGLIDYDERMGIIIQPVHGMQHGESYFPLAAGVGFSRNEYRWSPRIKKEMGLLRLVFGLGTRAVTKPANDYPRFVPLSHPTLKPHSNPNKIRENSQQNVDVINLNTGKVETKSVSDVLGGKYPLLRWVAARWYPEGDLVPISTTLGSLPAEDLVVTFDGLLKRINFSNTMHTILSSLEEEYGVPISIEFAVDTKKDTYPPEFQICLLQCRPFIQDEKVEIPSNIPEGDILFTCNQMIPTSVTISDIRYIVYIDLDDYRNKIAYEEKKDIKNIIGAINRKLAKEKFILIGPGRWGSSDIDLGINIVFSDISNSRMLIEINYPDKDLPSSYGTHFFQELVEANITPLTLSPHVEGNIFNKDYIHQAPKSLVEQLSGLRGPHDFVKIIDLVSVEYEKLLQVAVDGENDRAVGYLGVRQDQET